MGDADKKTFSEDEHLAIVSDRVARETADLTTANATLTTERDGLQSELDVAVAGKEAAEARATKAEEDLVSFKAEIEQEREAASRQKARLDELKTAAPHLGDDFFADTDRVARITAMKDEVFEGYKADLQSTGVGAPPASTVVPRETAMQTSTDQPGGDKPSAARAHLLGRYVPTTQEA